MHSKLMDLPIPKFVELVETNSDVTPTSALHPRPLDSSTPYDRLSDRARSIASSGSSPLSLVS